MPDAEEIDDHLGVDEVVAIEVLVRLLHPSVNYGDELFASRLVLCVMLRVAALTASTV